MSCHFEKLLRGVNRNFRMILSCKTRDKQANHLISHQAIDHGVVFNQKVSPSCMKSADPLRRVGFLLGAF